MKARSERAPCQGVALAQAGIEFPARWQQVEIAGHAAMNGHEQVAIQVYNELLAAPPDTQDGALPNLGQELGQVGMADRARPEDAGIGDGCPHDSFTQLTSRIFYFREFGHSVRDRRSYLGIWLYIASQLVAISTCACCREIAPEQTWLCR